MNIREFLENSENVLDINYAKGKLKTGEEVAFCFLNNWQLFYQSRPNPDCGWTWNLVTGIQWNVNSRGDVNAFIDEFEKAMPEFEFTESCHNSYDDDYVLYDGEIVSLCYEDLMICAETGRVAPEDEFTYRAGVGYVWRSARSWLQDYHSSGYVERISEDEEPSKWRFGVEVEKEDMDALMSESDNLSEICNTYGWKFERDSSLDDNEGFEMVSPIYDLFSDLYERDINEAKGLKHLLSADGTNSCGGHMHISCEGKTAFEVFTAFKNVIPLIYCMYMSRLGQDSYNDFMTIDKVSVGNRGSQVSVVNTFEIRTFPIVTCKSDLVNRVKFLRKIANVIDGYKRVTVTKPSVLKLISEMTTDELIGLGSEVTDPQELMQMYYIACNAWEGLPQTEDFVAENESLINKYDLRYVFTDL